MDVVFSLVVWVGLIMTWVQCYRRVGFGRIRREHGIDWRKFLLSNPLWFVLTIAKVLFRPATLIAWLPMG